MKRFVSALPAAAAPPPERPRRGPCQPGPAAQEPAVIETGGLKARSKSLREHPSGTGLQPSAWVETATWAVGPGWHGIGPLALRRSRRHERGVALVVTLLMLVVITVMAVAFLLMSQRETASVSALHSTTDSELAGEAALEQARAVILGVLRTNSMGPDLTVSTNRLNPFSVPPNQPFPSPTVFVNTNKLGVWDPNIPLDDRSYLDLNENGRFEESGDNLNEVDATGATIGVSDRIGDPVWQGVLQNPARPHERGNQFISRYAYLIQPVGRTLDLNWIHNEARPNPPAGALGYFRNQGVGSFELNLAAFLSDLNVNQWGRAGDYVFDPLTANPTTGRAFTDAFEFLRYRTARNPAAAFISAQFTPAGLLGGISTDMDVDLIDNFGNGPVPVLGQGLASVNNSETTAAWLDSTNAPWPGAKSPRQFFSPREFFDIGKVGLGFLSGLTNASRASSTYDRYTFYRMMSQLGTDSVPEDKGKINLNYNNTPGLLASTDPNWTVLQMRTTAPQFTNWTAFEFMNIVGDALLTNEFYPRGITNLGLINGRSVPVYHRGSAYGIFATNRPPPAGFTNDAAYPWIQTASPLLAHALYSPRIHQLLQMTANIYESTVGSKTLEDAPYYPSVFRPIFKGEANGDISIVGYEDETDPILTLKARIVPGQGLTGGLQWREFSEAGGQFARQPGGNGLMFYDIPFLFGARAGIPALNEITMHSAVLVTRRLLLEKNPADKKINAIKHSFLIGVSNVCVTECWNPYTNATYPRQLDMVAYQDPKSWLTTRDLGSPYTNFTPIGGTNVQLLRTWGVTNQYLLTGVPIQQTLPNSVFVTTPTPQLVPDTGVALYDTSSNPFTNEWTLTVSNRLRYFMFDGVRLVDSFTSARLTNRFDITRELRVLARANGGPAPFRGIWEIGLTNYAGIPISVGDWNQIAISRSANTVADDVWADYGGLYSVRSKSVQALGFNTWLTDSNSTELARATPFNAGSKLVKAVSWQVNDPFVRGTLNEMLSAGDNSGVAQFSFGYLPGGGSPKYALNASIPNSAGDSVGSVGQINPRYNPWGGPNGLGATEDLFNYSEKDPGVKSPNFWNFPSQKFPNIGWLGRVHRGTPWQTVFLKGVPPSYVLNNWQTHMGAAYTPETFPSSDWSMLDLFTTAMHPDVTRGRLSINQTNLAAWSAVFSGVVTATNDFDADGFPIPDDRVIGPGHLDPNVPVLVDAINRTRTNLVYADKQFRRLGELLGTPELSYASPYLNGVPEADKRTAQSPLTDIDFERLPGQILSLLKVGEPRFVVYAWGQSLKPAERGVEARVVGGVTQFFPSGPSIDPGTKVVKNYQITGETATRAVVRIDYSTNGRPHAVIESINVIPTD